MRSILILLIAPLLLGSLPTLGQSHPVPLATDNSVWLDSVQHLALAQQILAVQQRAWRDTLVAPYQPSTCRVIVHPTARRSASSPRLLAPVKPPGYPLVYVVNGQAFYQNDAATITQLQHALRSQPIKQATFLRDGNATAIYGSRAVNGVVILLSAKAITP
jgi:TonB-dependent SusC/RagA subfamily outer membrane receptor